MYNNAAPWSASHVYVSVGPLNISFKSRVVKTAYISGSKSHIAKLFKYNKDDLTQELTELILGTSTSELRMHLFY